VSWVVKRFDDYLEDLDLVRWTRDRRLAMRYSSAVNALMVVGRVDERTNTPSRVVRLVKRKKNVGCGPDSFGTPKGLWAVGLDDDATHRAALRRRIATELGRMACRWVRHARRFWVRNADFNGITWDSLENAAVAWTARRELQRK
jgi:hypothetical protein